MRGAREFRWHRLFCLLAIVFCGGPGLAGERQVLLANVPHVTVLKSEFIFETAPFPSCHASTIAETASGLVAAWFGGTAEKNRDVGIWLSRHDGKSWSAPVEVVNGIQPDGQTRYPCWNPVLFQPREGP